MLIPKEQLGGFFIIDVPDLDTPLEWAGRYPTAAGGIVEVRPNLPTEQRKTHWRKPSKPRLSIGRNPNQKVFWQPEMTVSAEYFSDIGREDATGRSSLGETEIHPAPLTRPSLSTLRPENSLTGKWSAPGYWRNIVPANSRSC